MKKTQKQHLKYFFSFYEQGVGMKQAIASNTVLSRAMNYFTENGLVAFDLHRKTDFYQAIDFVNAKCPTKIPLSENQAFLFHSMPITPNMVVFDTLKNKFYLVG